MCDTDKSILEFGVNNRTTTKLSPHCKKCERNCQLKYKFGITSIKYQQLLEGQKNCCAIKEVRGLLCNACNRGVGQFKDDVQILKNAYEYLKIFQD